MRVVKWILGEISLLNPRRAHLTSGAKKEEDHDPVDPKQWKSEEGAEGLQCQQRQVDEHFSCHVEQGDGQGNPLPHKQHQKQQNSLQEQKDGN